ncbi:ATP-binding protein [Spongiactinospora rosea]|uniref:ATP-binding protein n=1 Tax=Spongiactinospora rosea TaxID=2248750 RepID=A0A366LTU6_9ACTN|nr:ATP-binding protein [Spongiactinospora rosea]RBQ16963.1 ATP-binding protein [Spongiactinospora rosea]
MTPATAIQVWNLPSTPCAASQAREIVRKTLADRGLAGRADTTEDIVLVICELVTNALAHATPPIQMCLATTSGTIYGGVSDHGAALLRPGSERTVPDLFAEHGRGLAIVTACTQTWGIIPRGAEGKMVWFIK